MAILPTALLALSLLSLPAGAQSVAQQRFFGGGRARLPDSHLAESRKPHQLHAHYSLDVDWRAYANNFKILEDLDDPLAHTHTSGFVALARGDSDQAHEVEVEVKAEADEQWMLDCLDFSVGKSSLILRTATNCSSTHSDTWEGNACLEISIAVFVRPHALQMGSGWTHIRTRLLALEVWKGFWFETYHMTLQSTFGGIWCGETSSFTAHEIDVSTRYGKIGGTWSLPSSITFSVEHGITDIELEPKRWSSGPSTTGDLSVSSITGNIYIRMPLDEDKLSLRNSTTRISTKSGSVNAELVHGRLTDVRIETGVIRLSLLPYWAFPEWSGVQLNHITTQCRHCVMDVDILKPVIDPYYKTQPLYFAESNHTMQTGEMRLLYPHDWAGIAEWKVKYGKASIRGEDYEIIERGDGHGKLQRRPLGSHMHASVGAGVLAIKMKEQ